MPFCFICIYNLLLYILLTVLDNNTLGRRRNLLTSHIVGLTILLGCDSVYRRDTSASSYRILKAIEDRRAEQRDEVNLIRQIVAQLPPLQQQIFRMKEIEGYTADEIMQITGCTADNLRKNLSRARLKIRETYMNIVKQNRTK